MTPRQQAIKDNFIETFCQDLARLYDRCAQESSWLETAKNTGQTLVFAGVSYWALQNISSLKTPYGSIKCNPLACIALCACIKGYRDYQYAEQSSQVVSFLGSKEECAALTKQIAEKLYQRFEFGIQLLENSENGVSKLADFFVDAIASNLKEGIPRSDSETKNIEQAIKAALPKPGSSIYTKNCFAKKVKLAQKSYLLAIPGKQQRIFQGATHREFSIEGLLTKAPGYLSTKTNGPLYTKEGTNGETIYPPQRLEETTGFTPHPRIKFDETTYRSLCQLMNDPRIDPEAQQALIPAADDINPNVTENDYLNKLNEFERNWQTDGRNPGVFQAAQGNNIPPPPPFEFNQ